jgi:hypothetical protein
MHAARFLDTNILLYAYDLDAPAKREKALRIVEEGWISAGSTSISVQVLQELHVNLEKKGISKKEIRAVISDYSRWPVVESTLTLLHAGMAEQSRWKLSFWDSMILAAARSSGASELITEDLNHLQDYDGLRVVNPFL